MDWTLEKYQSFGSSLIKELPDKDFKALAEMQTTFFPDLLKIVDEEEAQKTFYRSYGRKWPV